MQETHQTGPADEQPRWVRLHEPHEPFETDESEAHAPAARPRWRKPASPVGSLRARERVKALVGVIGTLAVAVCMAAVLWTATGAVLGSVFAPRPPQQGGPASATAAPNRSTPTGRQSLAGAGPVPTSTPRVILIATATATQGAAAAPTAAAPTPQVVETATAPAAPTLQAPSATAPVRVAETAVGGGSQAAPPRPTTVATAPPPTRTQQGTHVVERGDTLFSIARRNGTTVGALVAANDLGSAEAVLKVGQRLRIPEGT
jgi:LysM repeat protein